MKSSSSNTLYRSTVDRVLVITTRVAAGGVALLAVFILLFLCRESWPAIQQIGLLKFLTDSSWHPLSGHFSILPMLAATLVTSLGALMLAAPVGVASAVFCRYYAPAKLATIFRRLVGLLAGIPSVVMGLWGLVVLVPILAGLGGSGQGVVAAVLVLALMILPTITLTADAALAAVPREQILGAAALGMRRWAIVSRIAIPAARREILNGLLLALARALGETMAVLMVAGNVVNFPDALMTPVRTLTANIALEMGYATADHRSVLFVSGLMLMGFVMVLLVAAEVTRGRNHA